MIVCFKQLLKSPTPSPHAFIPTSSSLRKLAASLAEPPEDVPSLSPLRMLTAGIKLTILAIGGASLTLLEPVHSARWSTSISPTTAW